MVDRLAHLLAYLGSSLGMAWFVVFGTGKNRENKRRSPRAESQRIRCPGREAVAQRWKLRSVIQSWAARRKGWDWLQGCTEEWKAQAPLCLFKRRGRYASELHRLQWLPFTR